MAMFSGKGRGRLLRKANGSEPGVVMSGGDVKIENGVIKVLGGVGGEGPPGPQGEQGPQGLPGEGSLPSIVKQITSVAQMAEPDFFEGYGKVTVRFNMNNPVVDYLPADGLKIYVPNTVKELNIYGCVLYPNMNVVGNGNIFSIYLRGETDVYISQGFQVKVQGLTVESGPALRKLLGRSTPIIRIESTTTNVGAIKGNINVKFSKESDLSPEVAEVIDPIWRTTNQYSIDVKCRDLTLEGTYSSIEFHRDSIISSISNSMVIDSKIIFQNSTKFFRLVNNQFTRTTLDGTFYGYGNTLNYVKNAGGSLIKELPVNIFV